MSNTPSGGEGGSTGDEAREPFRWEPVFKLDRERDTDPQPVDDRPSAPASGWEANPADPAPPSERPPAPGDLAAIAGEDPADDESVPPPATPRAHERRRRRSSRTRLLIAAVVLLAAAAAIVGVLSRDGSSPQASPSTSSPAPTGGSTTAAPAKGCPTGNWPSLAVAEPTSLASGARGYYVWNDFTGWHVRFIDTDPNPQRFRGTVTGSDRLQAVTKVPEDTEGTVDLVANQVVFDLRGDASARGFDLSVGCRSETLRFDLQGETLPWPVAEINLGREGRAVSNPLTIERVKP